MSAHLEQSPQPEEENPRSDARVLAEALRVHGQGWKTMTPQDPLLENFRGFWAAEKDCRRRVDQVEEQFLEMVEEAFPEVLPVFEWTSQSPAWEFIERYPGAAALRRVGARDLETFLRGHDLWETPCGGRCRALLAGARKKSGDPAQSRVVEEKLRETAKTLREARELAGKLQFQSAAILQLHPDFAFFGPAPGSEGEIGGPGEPRFSPA
jgi:hypothetical protein